MPNMKTTDIACMCSECIRPIYYDYESLGYGFHPIYVDPPCKLNGSQIDIVKMVESPKDKGLLCTIEKYSDCVHILPVKFEDWSKLDDMDLKQVRVTIEERNQNEPPIQIPGLV